MVCRVCGSPDVVTPISASGDRGGEEKLVGDFWIFLRHLTWSTWVRAFQAAGQQRLMGLASEMAYNGILALFPAILAMVVAIGLFDAPREAFQQFSANLNQVAPPEVMMLINGFLRDVSHGGNRSWLSLSSAGAIWAGSSVVHAAMIAMDQIHRIPPNQQRPFWQNRLISILLMLATLALLLLASFVLFVSDLTVQLLASQIGWLEMTMLRFWQAMSHPIALGLISMAFSLVYRWGPSRWIQGTPVFPGALLAALSWVGLSLMFRIYVSKVADFNGTYGTLGTVIIVLLWLYLGALAMLMGNQLNVEVGSTCETSRSRRATFPPKQGNGLGNSLGGFNSPGFGPASGPPPRARQRQNSRQNRKPRQGRQQQSWDEGEYGYSSKYPNEYGDEETD